MSTVLVNLAGIGLISFIIWWFWLSKPKSKKLSENEIDILVENGVYTPARIEVNSGKKYILHFLRKDPNPCAEKVSFEQLNITADLPLDEIRDVEIFLPSAGEYTFSCQMQMYRGSLVAV